MGSRTRLLMAFAMAGLVTAYGPTISASGAPSTPQQFDDEVVVATHTDRQFDGLLTRAGSIVHFTSRQEGASRAVVHVEVDRRSLDASLDLQAQIATLDGGNRRLLFADREILRALEASLARRFSRGPRNQSLHEHLLFRAVMYWADAPLGVTLPARVIPRPQTARSSPFLPPPGARITTNCRELHGGAQSLESCQQSGQSGIWYTGCNVYVWLSHDAVSHCFVYELLFVGPQAEGCLGRCGSGCGWFRGRGTYTYDCGDHDRCCREHGGCANPFDASCGDEFWEAADDFLWGAVNCGAN